MKPIEPGCLVIIIKARSNFLVGQSGTAIAKTDKEFVSRTTGNLTRGDGRWFVDTATGHKACIPEHWLLRIDDHDTETAEKESEVAT